MKIIFIGPRSVPATYGGIDSCCETLAYHLVNDKAMDVTIYARSCYTSLKEGYYRGIMVKKIFTIPNKYLDTALYGFLATLRSLKERPDIVHYQGSAALFSFIPYFLGVKVVRSFHGLEWKRRKWGWFAKFFIKLFELMSLRYAHAVTVVSKKLEAYFKEKCGQSEKIKYLPNGVEIPPILSPEKIMQYGLGQNNYILFVGRLVPEKGLDYLIDAHGRLGSKLKLVIAGGEPHKDRYVDNLKKAAGPNVIFTGYVTGNLLAELYSNAFLYVHPSELEGMSLSLLEAMSYGKCVLASNIMENQELIGLNGIFFKSGDVKELAEKINYLVGNPDMVRKIGEQARSYVEKSFQWGKIADRLANIYNTSYKKLA